MGRGCKRAASGWLAAVNRVGFSPDPISFSTCGDKQKAPHLGPKPENMETNFRQFMCDLSVPLDTVVT